MTKILFIALVLLTAGCSVYQSEGRKFLEEQAFRFRNQSLAVSVQKQSENCAISKTISIEFFSAPFWQTLPSPDELQGWRIVQSTDPDSPIEVVMASDGPDREDGVRFCQLFFASSADLELHLKDDLISSLEKITDLD